METEILKAFVWVSSRFGPVLACSSRVLAVFADLRGFHPFFVAPKVKLLSSGQLLDELPEVFDSLLAVVDQERMIYLRHQAAVERELQAVRRSQAVVKRMRGKGQRQAELLGLWSTSYVSTEIDGTQRGCSAGRRARRWRSVASKARPLALEAIWDTHFGWRRWYFQ